jgi:hypothetical protein
MLFFGLFGQVLCTFLVSVLSLRTGFFQFADCRGRNGTNSTRFRFPWRRGRPVESSATTASPSINASQMLSPPAPRSGNNAKERKGKRKWEQREQRKPRRTCSRPRWAIGVLSLRSYCVILVQRRSSVSYSHCKVSVASLFLCFTNCSFLRCSLLCYSSFFVVFISVVRLLRHFGLCYALVPLLSRTISGTLSTLVASLFPYFIALLQVAAFFV